MVCSCNCPIKMMQQWQYNMEIYSKQNMDLLVRKQYMQAGLCLCRSQTTKSLFVRRLIIYMLLALVCGV